MAEKSIQDLTCSFCGKNQEEIEKLIAGPNVYICNECVQLCNEILSEEGESPDSEEDLHCSFCAKNQKDVEKLVPGPAVSICNECIQLCTKIIADDEAAGKPADRN